MALGTEEKAYNTAILAAAEAFRAMYEAASADEVLQITPLDIGVDSASDPRQQTDTVGDMTNAAAGLHPSFCTVYSFKMVNDGEAPHSIPIKLPGPMTPLFWVVTNQAHDLDVT